MSKIDTEACAARWTTQVRWRSERKADPAGRRSAERFGSTSELYLLSLDGAIWCEVGFTTVLGSWGPEGKVQSDWSGHGFPPRSGHE